MEDCRCYRMDKESFQEVMANHPDLAQELSTNINARETGLDSLQASEHLDIVVTLEKPREDQGWMGKVRSFLRV